MSTGNLFQNCTWEEQYESDPLQFPRPATDEIISVYEVYIKEEIIGTDGKSNVSFSDLPGGNDSQSIQGSQVNLDAILESEIIGSEEVYRSLLEKNGFRLKLSDESLKGKENVVIYSQPISDRLTPGVPHHVDKNDPRSRLHFVKYLKRDGKTLKIWECGICSKEFRHQYTLMRHLPTHTDERNFKCDTCGKAFRQLSTLSQHKAIHSDARPYICEFCKKTFNRVSTLISHRKTHSENKPHKCHLCGKGFHQKGNLRNHVFTHTNERPYKCEICGKGFNQMSNLVCHKVKAHAHVENMRYSCTICGKEFPRRSSLRSHEEVKHGIKYRQSNNAQIGDDESNSIKKKNVRVVLDNDEASTSENNKEVVTTEYKKWNG
ncbi:zinc finger protein Gfi-1b-like [Prorops nasuta]|uniref:zinc finger protein Gfi-1b-like n=1 Tax=Prorops nasuta TaxID=863751 RepID=UPI0034CFEF69